MKSGGVDIWVARFGLAVAVAAGLLLFLLLALGVAAMIGYDPFAHPHQTPKDAPSNLVTIDPQYWVCTSSHSSEVMIWTGGTLTRFGRIGERLTGSGRYESRCDQWSAKFTTGCPKTNAWCQAQKAEK